MGNESQLPPGMARMWEKVKAGNDRALGLDAEKKILRERSRYEQSTNDIRNAALGRMRSPGIGATDSSSLAGHGDVATALRGSSAMNDAEARENALGGGYAGYSAADSWQMRKRALATMAGQAEFNRRMKQKQSERSGLGSIVSTAGNVAGFIPGVGPIAGLAAAGAGQVLGHGINPESEMQLPMAQLQRFGASQAAGMAPDYAEQYGYGQSYDSLPESGNRIRRLTAARAGRNG